MFNKTTTFSHRLDFKLTLVREGYLSGTTTFLNVPFEVEAFRMAEGEFNQPDNARPRRALEVMEGLVIDDVPLNLVEIPGHDGKWLLVMYPGEDEHYTGEDP